MSDNVAAEQLRLFIERVERLEEEKKGMSDDIRDVYPAPAFTAQPAISPASGQAGTTFTVSGEVISNGTVTSRQWLLNGAPVTGATSASYTPSSAGALACQVTATGAGGTTTATTAAVTVSAAAGFTPSLDHSDARNSQYL